MFDTREEAAEARCAWDEGRWAPRPRGRRPGPGAALKVSKTWINGPRGRFKAWGSCNGSVTLLGEFATAAEADEACAMFEKGADIADLV